MRRMSAGGFRCSCLSEARGAALTDFSFYGPTCDDADFMKGPFLLPADIAAGDYIEIGMLGAYGAAMKTAFNGFGMALTVEVDGRADGQPVPRQSPRSAPERQRSVAALNPK